MGFNLGFKGLIKQLFQITRPCCCHIRFWLVKKSAKAMNHTSDALQHTCSMSPQTSEKNWRMAYSLNDKYEDAEISRNERQNDIYKN